MLPTNAFVRLQIHLFQTSHRSIRAKRHTEAQVLTSFCSSHFFQIDYFKKNVVEKLKSEDERAQAQGIIATRYSQDDYIIEAQRYE